MPTFIKKFIVDTAEGAVAVLAAANLFVGSVDEAKALAASVGVGIAHAAVSAARRDLLPGALAWLKARLGVASA